jgi:hypothetical protein
MLRFLKVQNPQRKDVLMSTEMLVKYTPPKPIRFSNQDVIIAKAKELVEDYKEIVPTEDNLALVKKDRSYLRNIIKSIDQRRIDIKKEWMHPYDQFEAEVKKVTGLLKDAADMRMTSTPPCSCLSFHSRR